MNETFVSFRSKKFVKRNLYVQSLEINQCRFITVRDSERVVLHGCRYLFRGRGGKIVTLPCKLIV